MIWKKCFLLVQTIAKANVVSISNRILIEGSVWDSRQTDRSDSRIMCMDTFIA